MESKKKKGIIGQLTEKMKSKEKKCCFHIEIEDVPDAQDGE